MQASSTAKMALLAQQTRMDTIANNMANANTAGFKARQVTFKDMLYFQMTRPTGNQEGNLQKGTGVLVASTDLNWTQGIAEMTQDTMDFMLDGDGLFTVQDAGGNTLYTRNGSFAISVEGDDRYLVTTQGYYVLAEDGERIRLPSNAETTGIEVSPRGDLFAAGGGQRFAKLGLVWFPNAPGLDSAGNGCFAESVASGEPVEMPGDTVVLQGYLEAANMDMGTEMINLIKTQRAFSFASRAITTADEMDAIANNMRT